MYRYDYSIDQHIELLAILKSVPCNVILSGYRSALYDDLLKGWRSHDFKGDSHTGPRTETVWLNYPQPASPLHDYSYLGNDFRKREAIKRRRVGLVSRIDSLESAERSALFADLAISHRTEMMHALELELR